MSVVGTRRRRTMGRKISLIEILQGKNLIIKMGRKGVLITKTKTNVILLMILVVNTLPGVFAQVS